MLQLRNPFYIGFCVAILQESRTFPEEIERFHKSVIGLAKTSAPFFKKRQDRLPKPAALDTLVFLKIFKMMFSETVARLRKQ